MQDRTITNALLTVRAQIIRGNLDGLDHVNALLVARGVDPSKLQMGRKRKPDQARQGIMRLMVLDALSDGPKRADVIALQIAALRPEITPQAAHKRTAQALSKMRTAGLVDRDGRLWRLK